MSGKHKILIIDDSPGSIRTLAAALDDDYDISIAVNGPKGLDLAASQPPDLILLDVVMPDMDGYEVCRRLKASPTTSDIPVIFVSAMNEVGDEMKGLKLGAVDYIVKPFSPAIVLARVGTHLSLKRARNELHERNLDLEARVEKRTAELECARNEAEIANSTKSLFLASMSHEIRTPMAGVIGFADMLLDDNLTEDSREKVFRIKDSMNILLTLLNEILDLSKLEAGKMELEHIDFQLPSLINEATSLFERKIKDKELEFSTILADGLPEGMNSDPIRIRQIISNLVGNAAKFTDQGKITVKAELKESETGNIMLHVSVMDTGIGMTPEAHSRLFCEFEQADASISRKYQGSGLGLSICKRLAELMSGEIGATSEYGKGSTFWFSVPYSAARKAVSGDPLNSLSEIIRYLAVRPLHILIVDDNDFNLRVIRATVGSFGHTADVAKHGMLALEMFEASDYDLILMDVRMPVMSGPEATVLIRQMEGDRADIPIIALTADAMEGHKRQYLAAGMNAVVGKPIDRAELALTINTVMGEDVHVAVKVEASKKTS